MDKLIRDVIKRDNIEILSDTPQYCIMMSLLDRKTHKPRSKHTLPEDFNLLQEENSDIVMTNVGYG